MGTSWKGLCPFHEEKTPSFNVRSEPAVFHCFGCGVGGDIFKFVMQRERVSFPEAVESHRATLRRASSGESLRGSPESASAARSCSPSREAAAEHFREQALVATRDAGSRVPEASANFEKATLDKYPGRCRARLVGRPAAHSRQALRRRAAARGGTRDRASEEATATTTASGIGRSFRSSPSPAGSSPSGPGRSTALSRST